MEFAITLQPTLPKVSNLTFGQIKGELDYYNQLFENLNPESIEEDIHRHVYRSKIRIATTQKESEFHRSIKITALNNAKKELLKLKTNDPKSATFRDRIFRINRDLLGIPHPENHQNFVQGIPESIYGPLIEESLILGHRMLMVDDKVKDRVSELADRYRLHIAFGKTKDDSKLNKFENLSKYGRVYYFISKALFLEIKKGFVQNWKNLYKSAKSLKLAEIDDYLLGIESGVDFGKYGIDLERTDNAEIS
jgi:hypothetical protein